MMTRRHNHAYVLIHYFLPLFYSVWETKRIADNDQAILRLGYYKGYHGNELSEAIALFSEKYPAVDVKDCCGKP